MLFSRVFYESAGFDVEGAKRRMEIDRKARNDWFNDPKRGDELRMVDDHTPVWVKWRGRDVLQSPHDTLIGVPINGRKNSSEFWVVDTKNLKSDFSDDDVLIQLTKKEVFGWMTKASIRMFEDPQTESRGRKIK